MKTFTVTHGAETEPVVNKRLEWFMPHEAHVDTKLLLYEQVVMVQMWGFSCVHNSSL
jgi:hypothetical protein